MAKKRKTYTSPEVKNRWNKKHYETVSVLVPIGSKEEVQQLAEELGMSTSAYIRHLVLEDARRRGREAATLRGGGGRTSVAKAP